jgi:hypothetical protein
MYGYNTLKNGYLAIDLFITNLEQLVYAVHNTFDRVSQTKITVDVPESASSGVPLIICFRHFPCKPLFKALDPRLL